MYFILVRPFWSPRSSRAARVSTHHSPPSLGRGSYPTTKLVCVPKEAITALITRTKGGVSR